MKILELERKSRKIEMSKIQWYKEWLKAVMNMDNIEARDDILKTEKARLLVLKA